MSRTIVNFWLDVLLLLIFVSLVWVSLIVRFVFPPALRAAQWSLWGMGYEQWINAQFAMTAAMAAAVLLHLMLHWSWIWGVVSSRMSSKDVKKSRTDEGTKTLWGVGLLILVLHVLGFAMALALLSIRGPAV
ncbi:MAG: DUF4405 domain-containing protein [Planctomycetes bacterium]|nr:DUF4405 domain-containing protein [Planctomycetota bacterium]